MPLQYVGVHLLTFLKMLQNLLVGFREEQSKASLIGAFMLPRGVSRRRKVQIAVFFGYENPTAHVLLHRVSQCLGSTRGSGDENG